MAPQPSKADPVGELMAGVERYLAGLPDDAYQGLIAAVEKARSGSEADPQAAQQDSTAYPASWDQPGSTGRTRGGK